MSMTPSIVVEGYISELLVSAVSDAASSRRLLVGLDVQRVSPMGADEPPEGWRKALVPRGQIGYFIGRSEVIPAGLQIGMRVSAVVGHRGEAWEVRSITPTHTGSSATLLPVRRIPSTHALTRFPSDDALRHNH